MIDLYSYYRSSASYRIRIALNYKELDYAVIPVNLLKAEQLQEEFLQHNKQARLPALSDNGFTIGQSSAILEYLEEKYPERPLLPHNIETRGWIRYLSQIIISDIHPLNNLSVFKYLTDKLKQDQKVIQEWCHHWMKIGFDALEDLLKTHPECGNFCWGNIPSFADVCLIPQMYNAKRFNFPLENYPTLRRINEHCLGLSYFDRASPERQVDFPDR